MQAVLVFIAAGSATALWLGRDAAKHDWSGSKIAQNVRTWVLGSLMLWPLVLPLYLFVERKKAPLLDGAVEPKRDPEPESEPKRQLAAEPQPEPAPPRGPDYAQIRALARAAESASAQEGPSVDDVEPEPVVEIEPEPVVEIEPEPVVEPDPEPVAETSPEPVLEIAHPTAEDTPPGLSMSAFKDIKPVSFGGATEPVDTIDAATEPEIPAEPIETQPSPEPEPVVAAEPESSETFEPISYPALESEPVIELEPEPYVAPLPEPEFEPEFEAEPVAAAVSVEPDPEEQPKKKGRLSLPGPELRLPKLNLSLPPNLQGPLTDLERKIALGSVVAVVAAAAFGYMSAPSGDAASPAPAPPAATSR